MRILSCLVQKSTKYLLELTQLEINSIKSIACCNIRSIYNKHPCLVEYLSIAYTNLDASGLIE